MSKLSPTSAMPPSMKGIRWLCSATLLFTLLVIVVGAFTRLTDAGLGCPDWPGCYGQWRAPHTAQALEAAHKAFPGTSISLEKTNTEMLHRYLAEMLGGLIFCFALGVYRSRPANLPVGYALSLVALVLAQGLLGRFTVTLQLLPVVVLLHLVGGFSTLALLGWCWLKLHTQPLEAIPTSPFLRCWSVLVLFCLILQILLGALTSTHYAALICPHFPSCQGNGWIPFSIHALQFWKAEIADPLGFMTGQDKITIHMLHRLGAVVVSIMIMTLVFYLWQSRSLRRFAVILCCLLCLQLSLGFANVYFRLPLGVAVAHNGIAAVLLLNVLTLCFFLRRRAGC